MSRNNCFIYVTKLSSWKINLLRPFLPTNWFITSLVIIHTIHKKIYVMNINLIRRILMYWILISIANYIFNISVITLKVVFYYKNKIVIPKPNHINTGKEMNCSTLQRFEYFICIFLLREILVLSIWKANESNKKMHYFFPELCCIVN